MTFLIALLVGWACTGAIRWLSLKTGVLDYPNARSSHTLPIPTMGGIGLVVGTWIAVLVTVRLVDIPFPATWQGIAVGTLVLFTLTLDEVRPMGRLQKLLVQVLASAACVIGGVILEAVHVPAVGVVSLGVLGVPVTLIGLTALQNLYNFMDGLDGLAGLEGIAVATLLGVGALFVSPAIAPLALALAGGSFGFFIWNRPPAKIFMGDVGGHFLGLVFGSLAVLGESTGFPLVSVALFLGAFLFDALYTLCRRALRGENITVAHRYHLYQRLNRMGWGAGRVDALYLVVTCLFGATSFLYLFGRPVAFALVFGFTLFVVAVGTIRIEKQWAVFGEPVSAEAIDGV